MSAHATLAIEASGLEKSFGKTRAVCGVDLAVRRGRVYGILGPNGAGKTTTGLDPRSRNQVWDIIRALAGGGTTILLCTQCLDEADQLADWIAVIDHGRVIAEGTPGQLKASVGSSALHVRLLDPDQRADAEGILARVLGADVRLEPDPAALSAPCADADQAAEAVGELSRSGIGVANFSLGQPTLDEVFLALTGHPAEQDVSLDGATAIDEERA